MESTRYQAIVSCLGNRIDTGCGDADSEAMSDGKVMKRVALNKEI